MDIQDRFLATLRRYCQVLADRRQAKNATHAMADFALAPFFPAHLSWHTSDMRGPVKASGSFLSDVR
jgi:hypothetical protein